MNNASENNPFNPPQASVDDDLNGVESKFTLNLFSASGRIGRMRYLTYSIGLGMIVALVGGILSIFISPALFVLTYVAMVYINIMLTIKRCHDFNVTGWLSLLILIPLAYLVFLFIPGTNGANGYGRKTAPNGSTGIVLVTIFAAIFVIGILAAIAIPAYQPTRNAPKRLKVRLSLYLQHHKSTSRNHWALRTVNPSE